MASNHLTTKPLARAKGGNAVHAAAYILRMRLEDERTGRVWDYSRKADDVLFAGRFIPKAAAEWMLDSARLWNGAERAETRINSRTGRVVQIGLHSELTLEQNRWLLTDFIRENFTRKGVAAEVAIHRAGEGDERNIHAHVLLTTRYAGRDGLGEKDRDSNRADVLKTWRDDWEKRSNKALERHGHEVRISMQTLAAQGIERTPETHLGKTAAALERKGIETSRGDDLREARAENRIRVMLQEMEPVAVLSAVERMAQEESTARAAAGREAERDLRRGTSLPAYARELLSAARRLFNTMGMAIGNIIQIDRGDLNGQGIGFRLEAVAARRRHEEREAANYQRHREDAERKAAALRSQAEQNPTVPEPGRAHREPEKKRETLLEKLKREAAERGGALEMKLEPEPARQLERVLGVRRKRNPWDPDEPT